MTASERVWAGKGFRVLLRWPGQEDVVDTCSSPGDCLWMILYYIGHDDGPISFDVQGPAGDPRDWGAVLGGLIMKLLERGYREGNGEGEGVQRVQAL